MLVWTVVQIPFDNLLLDSESQSAVYLFAVRCFASFRFRLGMSRTICFTRFVRRRSRTALGRGPLWLMSSHLDIFVSNCFLPGMSVTSLFVTRLGRTQLGRGHWNTLILLQITPSDIDYCLSKRNATKIWLMTNFLTNERFLFLRANRD